MSRSSFWAACGAVGRERDFDRLVRATKQKCDDMSDRVATAVIRKLVKGEAGSAKAEVQFQAAALDGFWRGSDEPL